MSVNSCNPALLPRLLDCFVLCNSCLRILGSDFGNFVAYWHRVNYVFDNVTYLGHIDLILDFILIYQLSQLDLLEQFSPIVEFGYSFGKG